MNTSYTQSEPPQIKTYNKSPKTEILQYMDHKTLFSDFDFHKSIVK